MGFNSDELTVREEGGKVYVAMSDKLLFESGKAIVNEQGKKWVVWTSVKKIRLSEQR